MSQANTNSKNASFDDNMIPSLLIKDGATNETVAVTNGSGSPSTTPTGTASVPLAKYNATPTTRTEGQFGTLQEDTLGNLLTSLATRIAGEDIARGIMKVQQEFQPYTITTAGSYPASAGPCLLGSIIVQGGAAGTIKIYDNNSATGTPILDFDSTAAIAPYQINCRLYIGCYIVTSANTKVTAFIGV